MRKPDICLCRNKDADQLTAKLIGTFVFATRILQSRIFLNMKFSRRSSYDNGLSYTHMWADQEVIDLA